jgi:hypothetical protein
MSVLNYDQSIFSQINLDQGLGFAGCLGSPAGEEA